MCQWIPHITILGQGDDLGEWGKILVFVVMATFWIIGGLAKSLSGGKKGQQAPKTPRKPSSPPAHGSAQKRRTTLIQQLARKAEELQAAASERVREIERQAQGQHRPRPQTNQPGMAPRRPGPPPIQKEPVADEPSDMTPEFETAEVIKSARKTQQPSTHPLIDLSDPETLRKAILHCEILGKPLSMREPFE